MSEKKNWVLCVVGVRWSEAEMTDKRRHELLHGGIFPWEEDREKGEQLMKACKENKLEVHGRPGLPSSVPPRKCTCGERSSRRTWRMVSLSCTIGFSLRFYSVPPSVL
jgi:hypothetical protein